MTFSRLHLIAVLIGLVHGGSAAADSFDWKAKIDAIAQQHIAEDRNIGIVIGVVKDGETWTRSYGGVRAGDPAAPTTDTIFQIGSVSKVFTGLALGQLVVDGKVLLDDPIEKHLPDLLGAPTGQITLRELATHTSGLPRLPTNLRPSDVLNPYKDYSPSDLMAFLKGFQFEHPKPFSFQYSNVGVGLLGYLLSKVSGTDYDTMIRTLVARPLVMNDTGVTRSASQLQRAAQGYDSVLEENPFWDLSVLAGAGGLHASLQDMLAFLKANLIPDSSPLAPAIRLSHQVHATAPENNVGLGWFFDGVGDDATLWHNGQTGGFHSLIAFKPKEKAGIVMLTNTASPVQCLTSIVFGNDCQMPREYAHTEAQLQSFLGRYELGPGFFAEISRRNSFLVIQLTGQPKLRLSATSEGKLAVGGGLAVITFSKGTDGKIDGLVLTQNGADYPAKKVAQ